MCGPTVLLDDFIISHPQQRWAIQLVLLWALQTHHGLVARVMYGVGRFGPQLRHRLLTANTKKGSFTAARGLPSLGVVVNRGARAMADQKWRCVCRYLCTFTKGLVPPCKAWHPPVTRCTPPPLRSRRIVQTWQAHCVAEGNATSSHHGAPLLNRYTDLPGACKCLNGMACLMVMASRTFRRTCSGCD